MVARMRGVLRKEAVEKNSRGAQKTMGNLNWPIASRKSSTEDNITRVSLTSMKANKM
jgi:hypothetical protein